MYNYGLKSMFSIVDRPMELQEAIIDWGVPLENISERIIRVLMIGERWRRS